MMHEFAKYPDDTLVVFSDIRKKENGEECITVCFERPMDYGFDTIIYELPSYEVILEDGHFTEKEKAEFKEIVERGAAFFFKYARQGGLKLA